MDVTDYTTLKGLSSGQESRANTKTSATTSFDHQKAVPTPGFEPMPLMKTKLGFQGDCGVNSNQA